MNAVANDIKKNRDHFATGQMAAGNRQIPQRDAKKDILVFLGAIYGKKVLAFLAKMNCC